MPKAIAAILAKGGVKERKPTTASIIPSAVNHLFSSMNKDINTVRMPLARNQPEPAI